MTNYAIMNDIAFAFGVSQASVSLVLNEMLNARVFAPTRLRVKDIAQSLGDVRKLIPRTI